jgi:trans-aconitate 2-methyltransferase
MADEWDAATYDRIANPMARWGAAVVDRLPLRGDERVLDAGCGSGRVTQLLLDRLPRGSVVALDGSAAMLDEARRRLAPHRDRVTYVHADVARPLPVDPAVDAVLSTATFHWVLDHDALFANLAAVLRPDGWLVAQCGGVDNVASVLEAAAAEGRPADRLYFPTAEDTVRRLEASGFEEVEAWLQPEPTPFNSQQELEAYLATIVLRTQVEGMRAEERSAFLAAVARRLPSCEIDYVRLNIQARRVGAAA